MSGIQSRVPRCIYKRRTFKAIGIAFIGFVIVGVIILREFYVIFTIVRVSTERRIDVRLRQSFSHDVFRWKWVGQDILHPIKALKAQRGSEVSQYDEFTVGILGYKLDSGRMYSGRRGYEWRIVEYFPRIL